MNRSRIFLGIDVGPAIRSKATALQAELARTGAGVKWSNPENLHVTLLFLGDTDNRDLPAVCRAVQDAAGREAPFVLHVSGLGAFPNTRRPKVLWAGITEGADALVRLFTALEARLLNLGLYRKEDRGYTPHLTLGRVKGEGDGRLLAPALTRRASWDGGQTTVNELLVYSSELGPGGPVYTVVGRGELTGPSRG